MGFDDRDIQFIIRMIYYLLGIFVGYLLWGF